MSHEDFYQQSKLIPFQSKKVDKFNEKKLLPIELL
jgi:hypothetical protein